MDKSKFFENFDVIADAPNGVELIRQRIVDSAVSGKLVEQLEYESCQLEGDELGGPFLIPRGWIWQALAVVTSDLGQVTPTEAFTYIDVSSIDRHKGAIVENPTVVEVADAPSRARKRLQLQTVLYSTVRPYLRNIAIVEREFDPPAIASTAFAILNPCDLLLSQYLYLCLRSSYFNKFVETMQKGVAYPAISAGNLSKARIPVPPLTEQARIVAKVDELMALCDELEMQQVLRDQLREKFAESALAATE